MRKSYLILIAISAIFSFAACNKDREQGVIPNAQSNFTIEGIATAVHTPNAIDEILSFSGGVATHRISIYEGLALTTGFDTDAIFQFTFQNSDTIELGGTHAAYDVAVLMMNGRDTNVYEANSINAIIVKDDNGSYSITYAFQANSENPCLPSPMISGKYVGAIPKVNYTIPFEFTAVETLENYNGFIDHVTNNCFVTENGYYEKTILDLYNTEYEILLADKNDFSGAYINLIMYSGDSENLAPGIYQPGVISAGNFLPLDSEVALSDGSSYSVTDGYIEVLRENNIYTFYYYLVTNGGDFEGHFQGPLNPL